MYIVRTNYEIDARVEAILNSFNSKYTKISMGILGIGAFYDVELSDEELVVLRLSCSDISVTLM